MLVLNYEIIEWRNIAVLLWTIFAKYFLIFKNQYWKHYYKKLDITSKRCITDQVIMIKGIFLHLYVH